MNTKDVNSNMIKYKHSAYLKRALQNYV